MIEIEEMIIRLPGLSEEEARVLGREVAQRLLEGLPETTAHRYIPALDLQLTLAPGMKPGDMADAIAGQLLQQLKTT